MILADEQRKLLSEIPIEYLFVGPHSHKSNNPGFTYKTQFTLHFWQKSAFFVPQCEQNAVPQT